MKTGIKMKEKKKKRKKRRDNKYIIRKCIMTMLKDYLKRLENALVNSLTAAWVTAWLTACCTFCVTCGGNVIPPRLMNIHYHSEIIINNSVQINKANKQFISKNNVKLENLDVCVYVDTWLLITVGTNGRENFQCTSTTCRQCYAAY